MVSIRHRLQFCLRVIAAALLLVWLPAAVSADSLGVHASIPFPAPTTAAVVDTSFNGTTVVNSLQTVTGTCEQQTPDSVVTISRAGTPVGSGPCTAGAFSIQVALQQGDNNLLARTASASGQFGPDSQPIVITLNLPPSTPSQPVDSSGQPLTGAPTTPAEETEVTNVGAAAGLTATPVEPFSIVSTDTSSVTIHVVVGGGDTPYTITMNWGDGSVDTRTVDSPGTYAFTHTYQAAQPYIVHATVRDVLGAATVFNYAVMSNKAVTPAGGTHTNSTSIPTARKGIWLTPAETTASAIVVGVFAVGLTTYHFGVRDEEKILRKKTTPRSAKTTSKRSPAKKKTTKRK